MLFVALLKRKVPTSETMPRRLEWEYPEGMKVIAEYWLQTIDPAVIIAFEADSIGPIMAATSAWGDFFDITVIPAITAEEGLAMVKAMG